MKDTAIMTQQATASTFKSRGKDASNNSSIYLSDILNDF